MANTPYAGLNLQIAISGTAVPVAPANVSGGYIVNPLSAVDQGLGSAEPLYVDVVGACAATQGNGTIVSLAPGQEFDLPPGLANQVWANAVSSGHKFTCVYYLSS